MAGMTNARILADTVVKLQYRMVLFVKTGPPAFYQFRQSGQLLRTVPLVDGNRNSIARQIIFKRLRRPFLQQVRPPSSLEMTSFYKTFQQPVFLDHQRIHHRDTCIVQIPFGIDPVNLIKQCAGRTEIIQPFPFGCFVIDAGQQSPGQPRHTPRARFIQTGLVFHPGVTFGFDAACLASPLAWLLADCFLVPGFYGCLNARRRQAARVRKELPEE